MIDFIYQYEASIRLSVFLGGFSLLALWEWAKPKRELTQVKFKRWFNNIALVVCSTVVVRMVLPTAAIGIAYLVEQKHLGFANLLELPFWLKVLITFILLDLTIYFQHAMFHVLPVMWRFHRVHHSDLDCDVTTGLRFHPVEILFSILIKFITIVALGAPVLTVILFEAALNLMSMFTHSNIHLNNTFERMLRWFVVTPDMHRVHHSTRENETNSNFGFNISLWDRIFATYMAEPKAGHLGMTIGLDQFREPSWQRFSGLIYLPFSTRIKGYAINYRDTKNADELALAKEIAIQNQEKAKLASELSSYIKAIDQHALVSVTDSSGIIIQVNGKFTEISGYSKQELLGQDHRIVNSGTHPKAFFAELWTTITSGNNWHGEICNRAKNGTLYWIDSTIAPIKDVDGTIDRYISIGLDVTERKYHEVELIAAKQEAESANNAKSEFLSNMSHELRTPMNAVMGFSQLLQSDDTLTAEQKDSVQEITMGGKHMMTLINEVLDLSNIEAGKLKFSLEDCNLNNILKECLTFIESLAVNQSIRLFNNINPTTNYTIHVDYTRFKQVMLNLLSNAIKYNREKGTVTLSCDVMDNNQLRINVSDTGHGLTEKELQRLFKSFVRIGEYKGVDGTGIGLVITKRLVELMGGTVGVESEIGKGSHFWVQVPLS